MEEIDPAWIGQRRRACSDQMRTLSTTALSLVLIIQSGWAEEGNQREFTPRQVVPPIRAISGARISKPVEMVHPVAASELVLGLTLGGAARAYPINMLTEPQREIINDELGGRAIAATW